MSLIKCPECNKEISDRAKCWPNCGYELPVKKPIFQGVYCPKCLRSGLKDKVYNKYNKCPLCQIEMINSIQGTFDEVWHYGDNHPELKNSPEFDEQAYQRRINWVPVEYGTSKLENMPKCPACRRINISKIGTVGGMVSVGIFGLASSKIGKTYKCNNCGSTW